MDLKAGLADQSVNFAAWTTATGAPVTITSATAGLSLWYRRGVAGAKVAITPSDLATLETAHADGGILVIEGAEHRLDLPDAACAAGALSVSWGGTATGITIDGGTANLIGQENTATHLSHIAASLDWRSTHAWYVAKSGNDANGGHEFGDALLTVAAAVAAAVDGDVIIVYPGAYDEEVDASALAGLTLKSAYGWGTQITNAGTPLTVGDYATVEGLRLTNDTEAEGKVGLAIVGTATVKIDGCLIESKGRGIYCGGSGVWITDGLIRNTIVRAAYDGVNAVVSDTLQMADCLVFTDGTYDSSGQHTAACKLYRRATEITPRIVLQNSIFQAKRTDNTSADTYALSNNYCRILSRDCYYESEASSYSPGGLVCGVHSQGILSLIGGRSAVQANNAFTTLYSLRNSGGASSVLAVAPDVLYNATLTSGTITKTGLNSSRVNIVA